MEEKNKTFGELKKGDTIYFFFKDLSEGPHEIREYVLEDEPSDAYLDGFKEYNIRLKGDHVYVYEGLEFCNNDTEDTLNLNDYNYNCFCYGDEYWYFSPNKEMVIAKREQLIKSMIETRKREIDILNEKLNKHISEYGTSY